MKKIGIFLIDLYQAIFSIILKSILGQQRFCRFDETCSDYTKRKIKEEGLIFGTIAGIIRISKCQPFYNARGVK